VNIQLKVSKVKDLALYAIIFVSNINA